MPLSRTMNRVPGGQGLEFIRYLPFVKMHTAVNPLDVQVFQFHNELE